MLNKITAFYLLVFWGIGQYSIAQEYPTSLIPDSLKEEADAVMRLYEKKVTSIHATKAVIEEKRVITVLNSKGDKFARISAYYDEEFDKTPKISGRILDHNGKMVKKLKKSEAQNVSIEDGVSIISSSRLVGADLTYHSYPYTIEFTSTRTIPGLFRFSGWRPLYGKRLSLQYAKLSIELNEKDEIDCYARNIELEPKISKEENGGKYYQWEINNLKAVKTEILGPSISELLPVIYVNAKNIVVDGVTGDLSTWESYGKFYYELNKERDELPEEQKEIVIALTKNLEDPLDKIDTLYKHLQEATRYVFVALGVSGIQTFDANYVYENGFGDCKALTNYMKAMLKEVGIAAHATLVGAGAKEPPVHTEFAYDPFNHVILCVPMDKDTVWIECTADNVPAGYLGSFTEGRHVLILKEEGGSLVKTPSSQPINNLQLRKAEVTLDEIGNAKVIAHTKFTGNQQKRPNYYAYSSMQKDREDWLRSHIDAGSYEIDALSFEPQQGMRNPEVQLSYELTARKWADPSGSRLFLKPNVLGPLSYTYPPLEDRKQAVVFHSSYLDIDSVIYHLPLGYSVEAMPEGGKKLETAFGAYEANVEMIDEQTLLYTRKLEVQKIRLPASYYDQVRDFFQEVVKADNLQVVLLGKT